jgi:cytidine deaminase
MPVMLGTWMFNKAVLGVFALGLCCMAYSSQAVQKKAVVQEPFLRPETTRPLLSQFSEAALQRLETALLDAHFDGVLESGLVKDMLRLEGGSMTLQRFMIAMLPIARLYSMPATSAFKVGAVAEGASGNIYFGANLELANAPLGFTIHAEQSAIDNALAHGEKAVLSLAVTNAPCGMCRQFLNELTTAPRLQVLVDGKPSTTLPALLPDSFGPSDLGVKGGLLDESNVPLAMTHGTSDALSQAALQAASRSYSPYTMSYSGVALQLKDHTIVAGSYVESAAYNPSLPPVISAIDRLRFSGQQLSDISGAVLIELADAKISQEGITRLIVGAVSPGAELRVIKARVKK